MNFCTTKPMETDRQKKINAYLQAVEVMNALKRDGKLDKICKVKAIQIPLFKNIACIIWGNSEIEYGYGNEKKKMPKEHAEVKI